MALSFTKVRTQAALVAALCVGTGVLAGYLLLTDIEGALRETETARAAAETARRVETLFHTQLQRLAIEAAHPETIQALGTGARADRSRRATEMSAAIADAYAVSISARADTDAPTFAPTGKSCPTAGMPAFGTTVAFLRPDTRTPAYYNVVQPVHDSQQRLLGHVLACFPVTLLAQPLGADGYAELRQASGDTHRTIASAGNQSYARGGAVFTPLSAPGLQLAYWPGPQSVWRAKLYFYLMVVALAILGLLLTAYAFHRATAKAVQHDIKSLALMSQDVRSGQIRADYPIELRDFADVFQTLRDFGRRLAEEKQKLKELGLIDHLSQLSNRRHFEMRLTDLFELARTRTRSSVLILDLDSFKAVNDRYGHEAGDALIIGIAQALRRLVRHTDIVARLGGDEFCIIYACTALDRALTLAHRLRAALPPQIRLARGIDYPLRWSGGISVMQPSDTRSHDVLWRADQALIQAKRRGGHITLPYDPAFVLQPVVDVAPT